MRRSRSGGDWWLVGLVLLGCSGGSDGTGAADGSPAIADAAGSPPDAAPPDACDPVNDRPGVCPPRGLYAEPLTVELRSPPGDDVYYTLDGSEPDEATGTLYQGPIELEAPSDRGAVILRARAVNPVSGPRPIITHTYVFRDAVLAQAALPAGVPEIWGTSDTTPADYQMDPGVLSDPNAAAAALGDLPTVSLVLAHDDLWGDEAGIYMNPEEEGSLWERAASIEIFGAGLSVQSGCGARIQGGSSPIDWKAPKLSLRIAFKEAFGASELEAPIFVEPGATDEFDTLILDAHLNWTWIHPSPEQRVRADYLRDRFVSDLQLAAGSLAPHGRFVHLYLNGLYWGLYELHERPDEHFAAEYLGGDDDEYDVLKHTGATVVNGDTAAWNAMFALARQGLDDPLRYAELQFHLDLADFIDYMLVNFWSGNDDWPHHNWYAARRKPAGLWRFFSWDAEHVLKDVETNRTTVNDENTPGELYQLLAASPAFRAAVAARASQLLVDGSPLSSQGAAALYGARADEVRSSMVLESARWGDSRSPGTAHGLIQWQAEQDWLMETYFPDRPAAFADQLSE